MAREIEEIILKVGSDTTGLKNLDTSLDSTERKTNNVSKGVLKMAGAFAAAFASIGAAMKSSNISQEFDKIDGSLTTLFGSTQQAAKEFSFLDSVSNKLGVVTLDIANGYSKLVASMEGANISAEEQRQIFEAVTTTGTALGKTTDEINGVLTAFGQIASKGRVQSEELLQIAERNIPVNALLAEALGLTNKEMKDQVATGNVLAKDVLPQLAKVMQEKYANGALANATKDTARFNRLTNKLNETMRKTGIIVNEVVLALSEGAIGKAEVAFDKLLEVLFNISKNALPDILLIGNSIFDGLDTLVSSFGKTVLSVLSTVSEGWELLFNNVTGESNFIESISDSIAIAARTWPQLITTPFLMAFKFITKGLVELEKQFFKITDSIEEGALTANLLFQESFGGKDDVQQAKDALVLFFDEQINRGNKEPAGNTLLQDLDKVVSDLIKDNLSVIQDVSDEVVVERIKNEEKINDLILKIRKRFERTLSSTGPLRVGASSGSSTSSTAITEASQSALETRSVDAAKFLIRPISAQTEVQNEQLETQKKIERNTAQTANQTPIVIKPRSL